MMARKLELRPSSDHQRQCGKLVAFFHLHFDAETVGTQTVVSTHSISHRKNIAICDLSDTSQKRESAESVSQAQAAIYEDSQKMRISLPTDLLCNLDPYTVLLVKIESSNIPIHALRISTLPYMLLLMTTSMLSVLFNLVLSLFCVFEV